MKILKLLYFKFLVFVFYLGLTSLLPTYAFAATLSFSPATTTLNRGCSGSIKVNVDTAGSQTEGTDAIILYDPAVFTQLTITNGTIYSDYPGSNVDVQNKKITLAGLASVTQPFTGQGTLATINYFIPSTAPLGPTVLTFDFDPSDKSKTTDSNVIERGTVADVLSAVTNATYTIGSGTCAASGTATGGVAAGGAVGIGAPTDGSASATPGYLPGAGTQELTFMMAIVASTLTILGLVGFFIL